MNRYRPHSDLVRGSGIRMALASCRESGALLVEFVIAIAIITVGILGFLYATQSNFKVARAIGTEDYVSAAFTDAIEVLQRSDFAALYDTYHKKQLPRPQPFVDKAGEVGETIGELVDDTGSDALVTVTFSVDETDLPAEFGPIEDLDGDGFLATNDVSSSYDLLPTRLSISYMTPYGAVTKDMYLILSD